MALVPMEFNDGVAEQLATNLQGFFSRQISTGEYSYVKLTFTGNSEFLVVGMDRRNSGSIDPFIAVVQKYSNSTAFKGNAPTGFNTVNDASGMYIVLPKNYYTLMIFGTNDFEATAVSS